MAQGLNIPVGVNKQGGAKIVDGDRNDQKIIFTALSDNDSENAFQKGLGLGSDMIFDVNDPKLRALILRKVKTIFDDFFRLHRFKLLANTIAWDSDETAGELKLTFKYLNIESDEVNTFSKSFTSGA
jgi:hypothetical protein